MTWLDWAILVCVLVFAIRGFLRGTVAQVFVVLGLLGGLWIAGWVAHWVQDHWRGAQPALLFVALRWLVAGLAGLALAALFQWWGDRLGDAVKSGPAAWIDRGGGLAVGTVLGAAVVAVAMMVALQIPQPREIANSVARTRVAAPLMSGAADACSLGSRFFPGGGWLRQRFITAELRAHAARAGDSP